MWIAVVFSHKLDEPKKFFNVERLPFSKDISQLITFLGTTSVENDVIAALTDKHTIPFFLKTLTNMACVAVVKGERFGNRWQKNLRKKGKKSTPYRTCWQ